MSGTVHVIGAGVAGLATAVLLAQEGKRVVVYEAAGHAGGRCRSFYDKTLDRVIDNGNHLLLAGNWAFRSYTEAIGASGTYDIPSPATFAFMDLKTGEKWTIAPDKGRMPWWILDPHKRVPGSTIWDYLIAAKLAWASDKTTIADIFDVDSTTFKRFWEPLSVAVVNAQPHEAAAKLFWPVLKETLGSGEAACRACLMREGLSAALIDPAVSFLEAHGAAFKTSTAVRNLEFEKGRVSALQLDSGSVTLDRQDRVVLAVPTRSAARLLPDIPIPSELRSIVNGHFVLEEPVKSPPFIGLIGGTAEWVFVRGDVASVTISAADAIIEKSSADIAAAVWPDVCRALGLAKCALPRYRIIKERTATFAQIPENLKLRPRTQTQWDNLALAGDWTDTGLPATIEGALRSGFKAASWALKT